MIRSKAEDETVDQKGTDFSPLFVRADEIGEQKRIAAEFLRSIEQLPLPPPRQGGNEFYRPNSERPADREFYPRLSLPATAPPS